MQKLYHFLHRGLTGLHLDYYRVIHSVKTAIGCLIGLLLVWYFKWPSGQWVPITVMVVMSAQPHFGAAVQKATMRFLGTAAGVLIALLTLILLHDKSLPIFIVIFCASIFFAYIASSVNNISYAGTLGGVTTILILSTAQVTPIIAIERGCYIVLGIIIALLVSRFIFPIHAREALRFSIAKVLRRLQRTYFETASHSITDSTLDHELNVLYRKVVRQEQLLEEAGAGSLYFKKYKLPLFAEVIGSERKLYRLVNLMGRSLLLNPQAQVLQRLQGLDALHKALEDVLESFASFFDRAEKPQDVTKARAWLQQVMDGAKKLPVASDMQLVLEEHSYLFFLEQIVQEMDNLYLTINNINQ